MWPGNLKSITLRGGMNSTELWMLKERMDAGNVKMLQAPEQAWNAGAWHTLYGDGDVTYCICTAGQRPKKNPEPNDNALRIVTRVNKLTKEHADNLLAGWPWPDE